MWTGPTTRPLLPAWGALLSAVRRQQPGETKHQLSPGMVVRFGNKMATLEQLTQNQLWQASQRHCGRILTTSSEFHGLNGYQAEDGDRQEVITFL